MQNQLLRLILSSLLLLSLPIVTLAGESTQVQIIVSGGPSFAVGDLSRRVSEGGYGFPTTGYSVDANLRFVLPFLPVAIVTGGSYQRFPNSGGFLETHSLSDNLTHFDGFMQIVTLGFGVQYDVLSTQPVSPFVEVDGLLSIINATSIWGSTTSDFGTVEMYEATRFGMALGAGMRFRDAHMPFFLQLSGKYYLANLLGKQPRNPKHVWDLEDKGSTDSPLTEKNRSVEFLVVAVGIGFTF